MKPKTAKTKSKPVKSGAARSVAKPAAKKTKAPIVEKRKSIFASLQERFRAKHPIDPKDRKIERKKPAKAEPITNEAVQERLFRREEDRRVEEKLPKTKSRITEGLKNLAENLTATASLYKDKLSPSSVRDLGDYINAKKEGKVSDEQQSGQNTAHKILLNATHVVLGIAAMGAIAAGAAPLAGALTAAFFGYNSVKKALAGTGKLEEQSPGITSVSQGQIETDPVEILLDEYTMWVGNQDLDAISERVARFETLFEMEEEKWAPDTSMYTDEELEELSAPQSDEEDLEEIGEDEEAEMVSESAVLPRLTFRVNPACKTRMKNLRSHYDVLFGGRTIGSIRTTDQLVNFKSRSWNLVLKDGFNEAAFRSGRSETEPYTVVRANGLYLAHPVPMTYTECCSWIKQNVARQFL